MKKREKILAAVTGVLLVALAIGFLFPGGGAETLGQLRNRRDQLAEEVGNKKSRVRSPESRALDSRLRTLGSIWRRRSLPWDHDVARSLYQSWLRELVHRVKLGGAKVDSSEGQSVRGVYWKQRFTIRGRGTMEQLTGLLHGFYSADLLHKVQRMTIKPIEGSIEGSADLSLDMTIEALSLPNAEAKDKLSEGRSDRPALSDLADYRKAIVRRKMEDADDGGEGRFLPSGGLFAAYEPKRDPSKPPTKPPEPKPEPPGFDTAKHTYLTAILEVDGKPRVWMDVRTKGEKLKLSEGDPFKIDELGGKIVQIETRSRHVVIEINGERRRIKLGDSLHQTTETPDAGTDATRSAPP